MYELSCVRVMESTSYREYELSRVRLVIVSTSYREYDWLS